VTACSDTSSDELVTPWHTGVCTTLAPDYAACYAQPLSVCTLSCTSAELMYSFMHKAKLIPTSEVPTFHYIMQTQQKIYTSQVVVICAAHTSLSAQSSLVDETTCSRSLKCDALNGWHVVYDLPYSPLSASAAQKQSYICVHSVLSFVSSCVTLPVAYDKRTYAASHVRCKSHCKSERHKRTGAHVLKVCTMQSTDVEVEAFLTCGAILG
jgi:hypothetical protein